MRVTEITPASVLYKTLSPPTLIRQCSGCPSSGLISPSGGSFFKVVQCCQYASFPRFIKPRKLLGRLLAQRYLHIFSVHCLTLALFRALCKSSVPCALLPSAQKRNARRLKLSSHSHSLTAAVSLFQPLGHTSPVPRCRGKNHFSENRRLISRSPKQSRPALR